MIRKRNRATTIGWREDEGGEACGGREGAGGLGKGEAMTVASTREADTTARQGGQKARVEAGQSRVVGVAEGTRRL
eukprot:1945141-Rhodomonas_salina.1